mmetsp:Transcript_4491/g.28586  ORF Transcript_4491/g.28586 Transcript_4491/m.28586 type:complete len:296 (+) Transcript_4491:3-890(+)
MRRGQEPRHQPCVYDAPQGENACSQQQANHHIRRTVHAEVDPSKANQGHPGSSSSNGYVKLFSYKVTNPIQFYERVQTKAQAVECMCGRQSVLFGVCFLRSFLAPNLLDGVDVFLCQIERPWDRQEVLERVSHVQAGHHQVGESACELPTSYPDQERQERRVELHRHGPGRPLHHTIQRRRAHLLHLRHRVQPRRHVLQHDGSQRPPQEAMERVHRTRRRSPSSIRAFEWECLDCHSEEDPYGRKMMRRRAWMRKESQMSGMQANVRRNFGTATMVSEHVRIKECFQISSICAFG